MFFSYSRSIILILLFFSIMPVSAQWIGTLPQDVQESIVWSADVEEGNLNDWSFEAFQYPGGGIFNTGEPEVESLASDNFSHSGNYSARSHISNAWQAQNGKKAIRLMRWTDKPWDDGGSFFPIESYYSTFLYFPATYNSNKYPPWDPGDGGWWNIFQFKSDDADGISQPLYSINVFHDDANEKMIPYLYNSVDNIAYTQQNTPTSLPVGKWIHFETYYKASDLNVPNGSIKFWQDGALLFEIDNVVTRLEGGNVVWGLGNYTDHINGPIPGTAEIYFDDCIVSTKPIHPYIEPVLNVEENKINDRFLVYPNPTLNNLFLNKTPTGAQIQLFDISGKQHRVEIKDKTIFSNTLNAGIYFLVIDQQTVKFIKQ